MGLASESIERMLSAHFKEALLSGVSVDPQVDYAQGQHEFLSPPGFDNDYRLFKRALDRLPEGITASVLLMPAGRLGGSDYLSGILARLLILHGQCIILRTDDPTWEKPEWYPKQAIIIDMSDLVAAVSEASRAKFLYCILAAIRPKNVFNVNSRLAFETLKIYGKQLGSFSRQHVYYFNADIDHQDREKGYPVDYFLTCLPSVHSAIFDSDKLRQTMIDRYVFSQQDLDKLVVAKSPTSLTLGVANEAMRASSLVDKQAATRRSRPRPRIIWAGRFDRQKRIDLAIRIATMLPEIDFDFYGKAVLDCEPSFECLPSNIRINKPFQRYSEMNLANSDGLLYTSQWDGIPTLLLELGAMGMPVVASSVGGIPEVITPSTGWPVAEHWIEGPYLAAIASMLNSPDESREKAHALQVLIAERHSLGQYYRKIKHILASSDIVE